MNVKFASKFFLSLSICIILISCNNQEKEYSNLQNIISACEKEIQANPDYDSRIQVCNNAINSINKFLQDFSSGQQVDLARISLQSWETKKEDLTNKINDLHHRLNNLLESKVKEAASKKHVFSNITKIEAPKPTINKQGYKIIVNNTYQIRMEGILLGRISKLSVHVTGWIDQEKDEVHVSNDVKIEE